MSPGCKADIVALSLEPDIIALVAKGLVDTELERRLYKGMVTRLGRRLRRPGRQPEEDPDWDDLIKPGVEVITPNPFTSGGARWNVMAAYGAQPKQGKTRQAGRRVPRQALPPRRGAGEVRARGAADVPRGKGDVLITYENEAIFAQQEGPGHPVRHPAHDDPDREPGRRDQELARTRRRPTRSSTSSARPRRRRSSPRTATGRSSRRCAKQFALPDPPAACSRSPTLDGWPAVTKKFFDPKNGMIARIKKKLGVRK